MPENDLNSKINVPPEMSLQINDYMNNISGGYTHSGAIYFDGNIECWGNDSNGQVSGAPLGDNFRQISLGNNFSLAVDNTGTIFAWGLDDKNQVTNAPAASNFVKAEASDGYGVALRNDGYLVGWGDATKIDSIPSFGGVLDFALGETFGVILMYDGSVTGWGTLDGGNDVNDYLPAASNFIKVAAGANHFLLLDADGVLSSGGNNTYSQVSDTPAGTGFKDIDCGLNFSTAVNSDNKPEVWGRDNYSQITSVPTYDQMDLEKVAAGGYHGIGMASDGTLRMSATVSFLWGRDDYNQVSNAPEFIGTSEFDYVPEIALKNVDFTPNLIETANPQDARFTATLEEINSQPVQINYKLELNGSVYRNVTYYLSTPIDIDITFDYDELMVGQNMITITVDSNEELGNVSAGSAGITKVDNEGDSIIFSDTLISRETLVRKLHMEEIIQSANTELERRGYINFNCESGCSSTCQGCTGSCGGNCTDQCTGTCSSTCSGACTGGCGGGCSGCSDRWF